MWIFIVVLFIHTASYCYLPQHIINRYGTKIFILLTFYESSDTSFQNDSYDEIFELI